MGKYVRIESGGPNPKFFTADCTCKKKYSKRPGLIRQDGGKAYCQDCGQAYHPIVKDGVRPKKR